MLKMAENLKGERNSQERAGRWRREAAKSWVEREAGVASREAARRRLRRVLRGGAWLRRLSATTVMGEGRRKRKKSARAGVRGAVIGCLAPPLE